MAMIDPPFFPVATVEAFRALQIASASKEPDAMAKFAGAHPEIAAFGGWAKSAPWTGSYAEERLQQPQQLHLHRQFRQRPRGALVADAGGAASPGPARGTRKARAELPRNRDCGAHQERTRALDDAGHVANAGRSDRGPEQGVAGRPSQRRGRLAHRRRRSRPRRTARAATSISIRPSCRTASGRRTIRSPQPARRPTGSPTTAARPRKKTIREPPREPPNDERSADPPSDHHSTLHPAPANAALGHGRLHPGDAVHRRRHGVHGRAEISDARRHSQAARDRDPDPRADPPRRASALRRPAPARSICRNP